MDATESFVIDAGDTSWLPTLRTQLDTEQTPYILDPVFARLGVSPDAIVSSDKQLRATREGIAQTANNTPMVMLSARWIGL